MIINGSELKEYCLTLEEKYDANVVLKLHTRGGGPKTNSASFSKETVNTSSGKVVVPISQLNDQSFYEILNVNMNEGLSTPKKRIDIDITQLNDAIKSSNTEGI